MELRSLGKSEIQTPPIIFGAWAIGGWYWGGANDQQAINAINASIDSGVNAFDTAPVYGFGHSETVLGKALKNKRQKALIFTKVGLRWDSEIGDHFFDVSPEEGGKRIFRNLRKESIQLEVENSLQRLQTDYIDVLQCHWPDPSTEVEETMEALASLVKQGKVRAIGVSNFDIPLLERSIKTLGNIPLASNQPRYSLINRRIERNVLPWCHQQNIGTIVYSPIERGLLAGTVGPDREFSSTDGRSYDPMFKKENRVAILQALEETKEICDHHHCTFAQMAAAWCFHQPGVTAALVGARNPKQAAENAKAAQIHFSEEELTFLSNHFGVLNFRKKK